ncbi:hypothetical protein PHYSODRAFT_304034 [Phytophthora sojae]|uniref:Uncharacterized protein n=1 Tax=Phytophthora sojae (strain P6497) TaxID=1094619 RepID=G4ZWF3_PHYSP|nr:hypothetical protein PHYSODRAFT_304034 [Phytophthora sojae]EGZ12381.1 hypothetical protein PHYSODRAFT_304034 [Phytophthora sojae]|eukprot:XP_009532714.1 hypothetical protein PHYSODRAFT_304034 [Phytophthora sojae]
MGLSKYYRLVEGARRSRCQSEVKQIIVSGGAATRGFRQSVYEECKRSLPPSVRPSDLQVFANGEDEKPLGVIFSLDGYGDDEDNPLVVEVPMVWYRLMKASSRAPFEGTGADVVPLAARNTIRNMRDVVFTERRPILPNLVASQLRRIIERAFGHQFAD